MSTTSHKLSPAMETALAALPFSYTSWGGKCMSQLPEGVTLKTINALEARGIVCVRRKIGTFERKVTRA